MENRYEKWGPRKVVVVGAGAVGATFAYALAQSGLADEIAMIDANTGLARGQVLDLSHGQPFYPAVRIRVGGPEDYGNARLVVLTAGAKQRPGESRLELLKRNASIIEAIVREIADSGSQAVLVVVSNPVDVLTRVALEATGWPRERVIGSGTVLDSARLRFLLGQHCGVDVHNVHAYMLGEHGDSEFAAWSMAHVGGMRIDAYCEVCGGCEDWQGVKAEIERQVRESAYHIIEYKGATSYAVGLALVRIAGAVLRAQKSVLTVSTRLSGEYGLKDVCLSVPCVVSGGGVERIIRGRLPDDERDALSASASILDAAYEALGS
ncbi:MAG: L-lactate dehydrogenase [Desulfobacterales bacterium]